MRRLFLFELKKLTGNTAFLICGLLLLISTLGPSIAYVVLYRTYNGPAPAVVRQYQKRKGTAVDGAALADIYQYKDITFAVRDKETLNLYRDDYGYAYTAAYANRNYYYTGVFTFDGKDGLRLEHPGEVKCVDTLQSALDDLAGRESSYAYKKYAQQLTMMRETGEPTFRYSKFWEKLISLTTSTSSLLAMLLMFMIAKTFSQEYAAGMQPIIVTSRCGERKVTTVKLLAAGTLVADFVLGISLLRLLIHIIFGTAEGWDAHLNSMTDYLYSLCPYSMTLLEYYLIQTLFQFLGSLLIVSLLCFLSKITKSGLLSLVLGLAFLIYPFCLARYMGINGLAVDVSLFSAMRTENLFMEYKALNLFGCPVPLPWAVGAVMIAATALLTFLIYRIASGRRRRGRARRE